MAQKDNKGNWLNRKGQARPVQNIRPQDRDKDRLVENLIMMGLQLQQQMKSTKAQLLQQIEDYKVELWAQYEKETSEKGNITLTNYSGDKQIEVMMKESISFDEKLQIAKDVIDECLHRWSDGANANLRAVVDHAFKVDKKGKVSKENILGLMRLEIDDDEWNKAMDLVKESIQVDTTRQYINLRIRNPQTDKFESIDLNFSSI